MAKRQRKPEYLRRMMKALENGVMDEPTAALANVRHDDWCRYWKGGACNCDPYITMRTSEGDYFELTKDGFLKRVGEEKHYANSKEKTRTEE
jgi:hypothetical protein